jgi:hypothetical protein
MAAAEMGVPSGIPKNPSRPAAVRMSGPASVPTASPGDRNADASTLGSTSENPGRAASRNAASGKPVSFDHMALYPAWHALRGAPGPIPPSCQQNQSPASTHPCDRTQITIEVELSEGCAVRVGPDPTNCRASQGDIPTEHEQERRI